MLRSISFGLVSVCALLSLGCSFQPKKEGSGQTGPGGGGAGHVNPMFDGSANPDRTFVMQDTARPESCPSNTFMANSLPPDLLIVLDRSGSMREDSMGVMCRDAACAADTKWAQMTTAINQVVMQTQDKVRWGLKFFASGSNGGGCNVNATAEVPIAPANAAAITAAIAGATPGSSTPTSAAETQAGVYLGTVTDPNPKYILLATDGAPNCAGGSTNTPDDAGAVKAVEDVAALGFPTFVIGIATSGSTADGTLNMMAQKGGHPRTGMTPEYYPVSNSADLSAALGVIQGMVALPCQFQLGGVPSDLNAVTVTVNGMPVSNTDWTYGPGNRSIVFPDAGATCMGLKAGTLKDVVIKLPCDVVIIK
jgi:hypothetical protein